ncbi:unnamed protein product [Dovyalis caffra]|uniref:Uncharacterized protein n=1 Tax=Dovyalis caffra TaxID=77055 RepID=A0AAV1S4Q5_9ROSI|nr:unnamed protein product [Dovyalis caffra]
MRRKDSNRAKLKNRVVLVLDLAISSVIVVMFETIRHLAWVVVRAGISASRAKKARDGLTEGRRFTMKPNSRNSNKNKE